MILLDTHALVWWVSDPQKLSPKARVAIAHAFKKTHIYVSAISIWEIMMLVRKERIKLTVDAETWLSNVESIPELHFVPVNTVIARKSVTLPGDFHADPADRIIVATARELGATLITSDRKIRKYPHVLTIW